MHRFVLASLSPYGVLMVACLTGGAGGWVALFFMTVFVFVMDRLPVDQLRAADRPGEMALMVVLALAHAAVLPMAIWAVALGEAALAQRLALGVAAGLCFGQVSNSLAHELIHRPQRWARAMGVAIYVSLLFGHHASAHRRVHHVWVATERDPNSARQGQTFWRFLPRAWVGSFREGYRAERDLRRGRGGNPYPVYVGGACLVFAGAWALAGWAGALSLLLMAGYAQMQLLLADYIQHYGLRRKAQAGGGFEPAGPRHSWNAPHWYSSAMMLNAPRHSDHHRHPSRPFATLRLTGDMPVWPYSMPVMAALAMLPSLWFRVMDKRVRALSQDCE